MVVYYSKSRDSTIGKLILVVQFQMVSAVLREKEFTIGRPLQRQKLRSKIFECLFLDVLF